MMSLGLDIQEEKGKKLSFTNLEMIMIILLLWFIAASILAGIDSPA